MGGDHLHFGLSYNRPAPLPEPSKTKAPVKRVPLVARAVTDRPNLLIAADMNALAGTPPATLAANHFTPGYPPDRPKIPRGQTDPKKWLKYQPDNPYLLPLGSNTAQLDARCRWTSWSDQQARYLFRLAKTPVRYWW